MLLKIAGLQAENLEMGVKLSSISGMNFGEPLFIQAHYSDSITELTVSWLAQHMETFHQ